MGLSSSKEKSNGLLGRNPREKTSLETDGSRGYSGKTFPLRETALIYISSSLDFSALST